MDLNDAEFRCLEVAEKIIGCLNDGEVLKRYLRVKRKIYESGDARSPILSPHLKRIALENRELLLERDKAMSRRSDVNDLDSLVLYEMEGLQKLVLPDCQTGNVSLDDAYDSLLKVISAKTASNNIIRQKTTEDNATLRDRISTATVTADDEVKASRERLLSLDHKFRMKREAVDREIAEARTETQRHCEKLDQLEVESGTLEKLLDEAQTIGRTTAVRVKDLENRSIVSERRCGEIRRQVEHLRVELDARTREIDAVRAGQRFGVADVNSEELEQLHELEAEIDELTRENKRLSSEVRRQRVVKVELNLTEVGSVSSI